MGEQLHIHKFTTRYRLSPQTRDSRARLDRVLRDVLDETLELALAELAIPSSEELCIRELNSLVHLPLQDSDQQLSQQWSRALAAAIQQAAAQPGSPQVVRYASRLHGLIDFANGVAYNRLQRAWAWRQLGFVSDEQDLSLSRAVMNLVATLANEPERLMAVVSSLAVDGHLPALAERLNTEDWLRLSQSIGGSFALHQDSVSKEQNMPEVGAVMARQAVSHIGYSHIAQAVLSQPTVFLHRQVPLSSLVVLIAAESGPGLFLRPTSWLRQWLVALAQVLIERHAELALLGGDWLTAQDKKSAHDKEAASSTSSDKPQQHGDTTRDVNGLHDKPASRPSDTKSVATEQSILTPDINNERFEEVQPWLRPEPLTTDWGGLFFLYGVMDDRALPQQLMGDAALVQRPLGMLLQAMAEMLLPNLNDDVASAMFAGAMPNEALPWEGEPPLDDDENRALASHIALLNDTLIQRLAWKGEVAAMLEWLCQRPACLRADPGWLTVALPLDKVDTTIRRAALDLNPGYLPWLGRVVEIVYE